MTTTTTAHRDLAEVLTCLAHVGVFCADDAEFYGLPDPRYATADELADALAEIDGEDITLAYVARDNGDVLDAESVAWALVGAGADGERATVADYGPRGPSYSRATWRVGDPVPGALYVAVRAAHGDPVTLTGERDRWHALARLVALDWEGGRRGIFARDLADAVHERVHDHLLALPEEVPEFYATRDLLLAEFEPEINEAADLAEIDPQVARGYGLGISDDEFTIHYDGEIEWHHWDEHLGVAADRVADKITDAYDDDPAGWAALLERKRKGKAS